MTAVRQWLLADQQGQVYQDQCNLDAIELGVAGCRVNKRTLRSGVSAGVDLVELDNGKLRLAVLPTRGMGLWKAWLGDWEIGWQSPVQGPVNPAYVPSAEPAGLGWLEGFDELLCRCGLTSNGAPEFDDHGRVKYPLHGLVSNLPAAKVEVIANADAGEICLRGVVYESRVHFAKLRLTSTLVVRRGQAGFKIIDEVTNLSGNPGSMELLYHVNFGQPLLGKGAKIVAPVDTLVPRNPHAATGIETWETYEAPTPGFEEMVYFAKLAADAHGQTGVLLHDAAAARGVSLQWNTKQLPCFTLWKNTAPLADGYVTGLEPGINYPNPRSYEEKAGRVRQLAPGETAKFELSLTLHEDAASVQKAQQRIAELQGGVQPTIHRTPQPGWTESAGSAK